MFNIYYSNLLETQKDILWHLMQKPLADPFAQEVVLVQSPGMEQWLNWQIAEKSGIASNISYPMPASFIWQLYVENLPNVEAQSVFRKENLVWRLMRLLPQFLAQEAFAPLQHYLASHSEMAQQKCYQLAYKIADLFDQYLVYRPEWIALWEAGKDAEIYQQIKASQKEKMALFAEQIEQHLAWQGILWRGLIADIQEETQMDMVQHRANLHRQLLAFLAENKPKNLPERLFIFGISALPKTHLETLQALSQYCDVHLFFTNGCQEYWGDVMDPKMWQKLQLRQRLQYQQEKQQTEWTSSAWLTAQQVENLQQASDTTSYDETLQVGNPLLASWGKMGRDFLFLLTEVAAQGSIQANEIEAYVESSQSDLTLLNQVQQKILHFDANEKGSLQLAQEDRSLTLHSCYSQMREVEVLQDYLLHLFNENPTLTPKDVVIMVADIDKYTPYIQAIFGQSDPYIPFAISDNKLTESDILVASFLQLLQLKNSQFSAEDILAFLEIPDIRARFGIELKDLEQIHYWVKTAGVRFGLAKNPTGNPDDNAKQAQKNYNAWQAGLERILLGFSLREENGIWQDSLGLDSSAGLQGQLAGKLTDFIVRMWQWQQDLSQAHFMYEWREILLALITDFFDESQQSPIWRYLTESVEKLSENVEKGHFSEKISAEVISQTLQESLQDSANSYRFTLGKMNFCTLLPMRSIPFKVVCLLGMNDGEYPRLQVPNSFDLMQYYHQKGDRFRRDDDRYLFLEALLSAQQYFYVSYVGRSIVDDSFFEPSILLSQLKDYLLANFTAEDAENYQQQCVYQHPMSAFSAKNYTQGLHSFAKKWLPLAQGNTQQKAPAFLVPLEALETHEDKIQLIDFEELVSFVQDPVTYFFEQRLGIYYRQNLDSIKESENFALDNLENYQINHQLFIEGEENFNTEWEKWQIKGQLPRGKFADIYALDAQKKIHAFREKLNTLVSREAWEKEESLNLQLELADNIKLKGTVTHFIQRKRISYRLANVKGKDMVQAWMHYLFLIASENNVEEVLHLGNNGVFQLGKKGLLSAKEAQEILLMYARDFLAGKRELFLLPNVGLTAFLEDLETEKGQEKALKEVHKLCHGEYHNTGRFSTKIPANPYWSRIARQQDLTDNLAQMQDELVRWFHLLQKQSGFEKF